MTPLEAIPAFDPGCHLLSSIHHPHAHALHTRLASGVRVHPLRESLSLAMRWLDREEASFHECACRILESVAALQKTDAADIDCFGVWPWLLEEPDGTEGAMDSNTSCFFGSVYALVLRHQAPRLDATAFAASRLALERAAEGIARRPFCPEYTNIALLGIACLAPAGEQLGRTDLLRCAKERLAGVEASVRRHSGFAEYNSPAYTPVAIEALERILHGTQDEDIRNAALHLHDIAWGIVAEHYHAPTRRWAGPFSRTYSDLPSMELILARCGLSKPSVPLPSWALPPPAAWCERFRKAVSEETEIRRLFISRDPPRASTFGTTWMDAEACLGSACSDNTTYQRRPLIGYWVQSGEAVPAVFRVRCLRDGHDFASCILHCAQRGPHVLLAVTFAQNLGDVQHVADRPDKPVFPTTRLVLRLQVQGVNATAELDGHGGGCLRAGTRCVDFASIPSAPFGTPVQWTLGKMEKGACAEAVLFASDAPRPLDFRNAREPVFCALALRPADNAPIIPDLARTHSGAIWNSESLALSPPPVSDYP